ncbi:MAG: TonB-dependent receptor [bacterium]|nr:TonB-dependent receptor [bacterium]
MKKLIWLSFVLVLVTAPLTATTSTGTINGKIREYLTNRIIPGVHIQIVNTTLNTLSDENGEFEIPHVPTGSFNVKITANGFKPVIKTDVIVRPKRITYLDMEMQVQILQLKETIEVSSSYFHESEETPHSVFNMSAEEVRRGPGAFGDISRALRVLPGVTGLVDENTELIVRGGSPIENGFYIDNIEVPNINHLPRIASTGGAISALNQDLVQNADFFSGGFSSDYGHRLSSILDITFREGNKKEFDGQIDLNVVQAGGVLEGPLPAGNGSWLVSVRKSYFKLLQEAKILNVDAVPDTLDSQVKLTIDLSPKHKVNILNIFAKGRYEEDYDDSNAHEINTYTQNTVGINWIANWSEKFISNTSLSYSFLDRNDGETFYFSDGTDWQWNADNSAKYLTMRNFNYLFFNNRNKIEFGFQVRYQSDTIGHFLGEYTNWFGDVVPDRTLNYKYETINSSLFLSYIIKPTRRLTTTIGFRGDYSSEREEFHLSPRFSFSYAFSPRFSFSGGFGIFYQGLPMNILAYRSTSSGLNDMRAVHYTAGLEYFPGAGTKISLEVYDKEYKYLPIDPLNPRLLVTDTSIDSYYIPALLNSSGSGYSRGVELLIHKKLVKKFYGIFSATYFRSRYKDLEGEWRNRAYDNRYIINLSGGFKPDKKWEFSFRWTLVGGSPYTPFDVARSIELKYGVSDQSRFLGARLPVYNTLNLRFERRFYFGNSSLIVYLDIWNILNRENIYRYEWVPGANSLEGEHHLTILPLFGIEYEF